MTDFESNVKFQLYSANLLNTVFGIAESSYNISEKTITNSLTARFSKLYPVIDITSSFGQRYQKYSETYNDRWNEAKANINVKFPFNITRGIYNRSVNLNVNYGYTHTYDKGEGRFLSGKKVGDFSSLEYSGFFYNFMRQASRDLNPKFGQFFYLSYINTPFNKDLIGSQFSCLASIYLPGIFRNNSFKISGGFEVQKDYDANNNNDYYLFSSPQSFSRGHDRISWDRFWELKFDYLFPVWYPDFGIGSIIYFKRLRAGFFGDYTKIRNLSGKYKTYKSAGMEAYIQFHIFRLKLPLEIGGRVSYIFKENNNKELFIPEIFILGIPF